MLENVPLAPYTTLEVGGNAEFFLDTEDLAEALEAIGWARGRELPVTLLGGGSNVLVSDRGIPGLVLRYSNDRVERLAKADSERVWVRCSAGKVWDNLVQESVEDSLAGIECLSGIPGLVGAAPIQNIGAYGQEVSQTIVEVEVVDMSTLERRVLAAEECGFDYRESNFKTDWKGRYLIISVTFSLLAGGAPTLRYGELTRALGESSTLLEVRDKVLQIRRSKSMVLDPEDDNRRSAGSFFTNPIVEIEVADRVEEEVRKQGFDGAMPRYPYGAGHEKLSAAWLIERSGFEKGYQRGRARLSTRHVLAVTNRGGARAMELVDLAREVRRGVMERFGVSLWPEPNFLGFEDALEQLL